jgi:hypothetical protein
LGEHLEEIAVIIKGRSRAGADELSTHLMRIDTNERLEILGTRGTVATDVRGALREMLAVASGTRCKKGLYHASINVRVEERMTQDQWRTAIDRLEERLMLSGHSRVVVLHEKHGREHVHIVWSRIGENMRAVPDSFNYRAHEEVAREMEREFGHQYTQGAHLEREGVDRPVRTRSHRDQQQESRTGVDGEALIAEITALWKATETGRAFVDALREKGIRPALGDKRVFVIIDRGGGVHALARRIEGVRTAGLRERMQDVDPTSLPSVAQAREEWRSYALAASKGQEAADSRQDTTKAILEGLFRTKSYVTEGEVAGAFEDAGIRDASLQAAKILQGKEILGLREPGRSEIVGYTTCDIRHQEEALIRSASALAAQSTRSIKISTGSEIAKGLSDQQLAAAREALRGPRLSLIIGRSGTGKSTTLNAIRMAAEHAGYQPLALAPTNTVVQDLRESGFSRATTVHSLMWYRRNAPEHASAQLAAKTLIVVDEAAMLDTARLADVVALTQEAGPQARLILVGDDRQLASIERGGLFGPLAERIGAAELTEVKRQSRHWSRKASEAFAEGRFRDGLEAFADRGWISWSTKLDDARSALLARYEHDTADERGRRFIFAYTNEEVRRLNDAVQQMEIERGRVTNIASFETSRGTFRVGEGDRVMIRGTDKKRGLLNGALATVQKIDGETLSLRTERGKPIFVDLTEFDAIELGYAGTIYRAQGKTLDQTYVLHTRHWRDASSYVALTRARHSTQVFVAREQARDLPELAIQMARQSNRSATIVFEVTRGAEEEGQSHVKRRRELSRGDERQ